MILEPLSLTRQLEMVFRELREELASLASGTIFMQIRNNLIGKFGVKHDPIKSEGDSLKNDGPGLSEQHLQALHRIGMLSLQKKKWTHGEIQLEFTVKGNSLDTSIFSESNYNMNHLQTDR
ncbi:MAG: O-methyltransferase [Paenibacillaceae bacterium]